MTITNPIKPGYGTRAVFGREAQQTDFTSEVQVGALRELGDDLDLPLEEQQRIIANVQAGRSDPWHH